MLQGNIMSAEERSGNAQRLIHEAIQHTGLELRATLLQDACLVQTDRKTVNEFASKLCAIFSSMYTFIFWSYSLSRASIHV
jgi:hypothetical protein